MLMQDIDVQRGWHSGFAGLAFVLVAQQIFVRHDVRPMMTARVVHTQQHLTEAGQTCQRFECLSRKR